MLLIQGTGNELLRAVPVTQCEADEAVCNRCSHEPIGSFDDDDNDSDDDDDQEEQEEQEEEKEEADPSL